MKDFGLVTKNEENLKETERNDEERKKKISNSGVEMGVGGWVVVKRKERERDGGEEEEKENEGR